MAFTNLPPDLTLPPGGSLTPGSGTVYIGGPQLPVGIATDPQYKAAIIFYTDAIGLSMGIDYWFIAHFSLEDLIKSSSLDGVRWGYYPTGGPQTVPMVTPLRNTGLDQTFVEALDEVIVQTTGTNSTTYIQANGTNGAVQLLATSKIFMFATLGKILMQKDLATVTEALEITGLGTAPKIRALGSSTVDVWQTDLANISTVGASTLTSDWEVRITVDKVVEVRLNIHCSPALPNTSFTIPVSGLLPHVNNSDPLNAPVKNVCRVDGAPNGFAPVALTNTLLFVDYTASGASGNNATQFSCCFMYTGDK